MGLPRVLHNCQMKAAYRTKRSAKNQAFKYRRIRGGTSKPYRCQACGKWHLTNRKRRTR